jgi:hypothetical protein|tara:strand:+ start:48 stop:305 length:258 start_codon:yes stop_codon:yes gene_type:complete
MHMHERLEYMDIDVAAECLPLNDRSLYARLWELLSQQLEVKPATETETPPEPDLDEHLNIPAVWIYFTDKEQRALNAAAAVDYIE